MGVQPRRTRVGVGVGVGKTGQGWGGGDEDRLGAVRSGAGDWFDRWGDAVRLCGPRRPRWWPGVVELACPPGDRVDRRTRALVLVASCRGREMHSPDSIINELTPF